MQLVRFLTHSEFRGLPLFSTTSRDVFFQLQEIWIIKNYCLEINRSSQKSFVPYSTCKKITFDYFVMFVFNRPLHSQNKIDI